MLGKMKHLRLSVTLGFLIMSTAGCIPILIGAAAGAGGYAWMRGILTKKFETPAENLHKATITALKKLNIAIIEDKHDRISAKIIAESSDGKIVKITINAVTERVSKIKIRAGFIGDRAESEMILNAIRKYL